MTIIFSTAGNYEGKDKESSKTTNVFSTAKSPEVIGPYSKGYFAGDLFFSSGQIGLNPKTMELVEGGIEEQTKQACRNISSLLSECSLSLKDVVKTTVYLKKISDYNIVNEIYKNYFLMKPARTLIEVSALPKNALIEIEVVAIKKIEEKEPKMEKHFESIS